MPSMLLTMASGACFPIISGCPWSGQPASPYAGVQFRWAPNASGNCYIGLSGGMTVNSGGFFLSGTLGTVDGMILGPGDAYFVPKLGTGLSGNITIFAGCDAAASGQGRLYWERF